MFSHNGTVMLKPVTGSVDEELAEATVGGIVADHVLFSSLPRVIRIVTSWLLIIAEPDQISGAALRLPPALQKTNLCGQIHLVEDT